MVKFSEKKSMLENFRATSTSQSRTPIATWSWRPVDRLTPLLNPLVSLLHGFWFRRRLREPRWWRLSLLHLPFTVERTSANEMRPQILQVMSRPAHGKVCFHHGSITKANDDFYCSLKSAGLILGKQSFNSFEVICGHKLSGKLINMHEHGLKLKGRVYSSSRPGGCKSWTTFKHKSILLGCTQRNINRCCYGHLKVVSFGGEVMHQSISSVCIPLPRLTPRH